MFFFFFNISIFRGHSTREPASGSDLFYFAGLHRNNVLATTDTGQIGKSLGKNASEWTGRVEIGKKEIPGSRRSMYGYILTYSRL